MGYITRVQSRPCSSLQCIRQDGWNNLSPRTRDIFDQFNDIFSIPVRFNSLLQDEYQRQLARFHHNSGFRHYEVREDDSKMQLLIDVPGIPASDMKIQLEQEGRVVKISGSREHKIQDKETSSDTFEQRFTVDPKAVDVANLSASLIDGVLTISVPKLRQPKIEDTERVIPIETTKENSLTNSISIGNDREEEEVQPEEVTDHNDNDLEITEEDI